MNRLAILLGIIVLLVNLVRAFPDLSFQRAPAPRKPVPAESAPLPVPPPSAFAGRPVPGPRPDDPLTVVQDRAKETADTVGTAFAVDANGRWITARHVIDGCRSVSLFIDGRWVTSAVLAVHPSADAALVGSPGASAPPLPFGPTTLLFEQDGFHTGYPKFEPGDVHSRLLGRVRVVNDRREGQVEYAYVWAELSRNPDRQKSLAGISGGPVLDGEGRLIGITIAESSRRGRITTSSPETIRDLAGPRPVAESYRATGADNFAERGRALRYADTVVRVYCARTGNGLPRVRRGDV